MEKKNFKIIFYSLVIISFCLSVFNYYQQTELQKTIKILGNKIITPYSGMSNEEFFNSIPDELLNTKPKEDESSEKIQTEQLQAQKEQNILLKEQNLLIEKQYCDGKVQRLYNQLDEFSKKVGTDAKSTELIRTYGRNLGVLDENNFVVKEEILIEKCLNNEL